MPFTKQSAIGPWLGISNEFPVILAAQGTAKLLDVKFGNLKGNFLHNCLAPQFTYSKRDALGSSEQIFSSFQLCLLILSQNFELQGFIISHLKVLVKNQLLYAYHL